MSQISPEHRPGRQPVIPTQPEPPRHEPGSLPPIPPQASEATRRLCAGAYVDEAFRDAVIDELCLHPERIVAPSSGIDVTRVLTHALRARSLATAWAMIIVTLGLVGLVLADVYFALLLAPAALLGLAAEPTPQERRTPRWLARGLSGTSGLLLIGFFGAAVVSLVDPGLLPLRGSVVSASSALGIAVAMAGCGALRRRQTARIITKKLRPAIFQDRATDHTGFPPVRYGAVAAMISREQHSQVILYSEDSPFRGFGQPVAPWALALRLRGQDGVQPRADERIAEDVLTRVAQRVAELRASASSALAGGSGMRDRLRALQIDECVFLPTVGLPDRAQAPTGPEAFVEHRERALGEGSDVRRHYLRIRVAAHDEGVVVTVFVRAHTLGQRLMMEVVPHVLHPVRAFGEGVEGTTSRSALFAGLFADLWRVPVSAARAVAHLIFRTRTALRLERSTPSGPWVAIRELGSDNNASLFQELDISRYLQAIQDQVTAGALEALRDAGLETSEFEQRIINFRAGVNLATDHPSVAPAAPPSWYGFSPPVQSPSHSSRLGSRARSLLPILITVVLLGAAWVSTRSLLESLQQHSRLGPSDAPAVVVVTVSLVTASGVLIRSLARLIQVKGSRDADARRADNDAVRAEAEAAEARARGQAELIRAQADMLRAQQGLPALDAGPNTQEGPE